MKGEWLGRSQWRRPRQLRLFERLSVVIDLHLISSMCSAGGNASHVATAGKTGLGRKARRGGGCGEEVKRGGGEFFVLDLNGEESGAPVPVRRGCSLLLGLFKELEPFGTGSEL